MYSSLDGLSSWNNMKVHNQDVKRVVTDTLNRFNCDCIRVVSFPNLISIQQTSDAPYRLADFWRFPLLLTAPLCQPACYILLLLRQNARKILTAITLELCLKRCWWRFPKDVAKIVSGILVQTPYQEWKNTRKRTTTTKKLKTHTIYFYDGCFSMSATDLVLISKRVPSNFLSKKPFF